MEPLWAEPLWAEPPQGLTVCVGAPIGRRNPFPTHLEEGPELPGLLQVLMPLVRQLLQLLQTGGHVVDPVTDHLGVARLVT